MHLVIYFCGTGNQGDSFHDGYNYIKSDANVSTVFVKGCDDPEVCDAGLFPNLNEFAKRFASKLFTQHNKDVSLTASQDGLENLQVGIQGNRSKIKMKMKR